MARNKKGKKPAFQKRAAQNGSAEEMMTPQQEMNIMQLTREEAQGAIQRRDDMLALMEDPRFDKLIMQGYFESEAIRLVQLKADPTMTGPDKQRMIVQQIDAIGMLNQYFRVINTVGSNAESSIFEADKAIEELSLEIATENGSGVVES